MPWRDLDWTPRDRLRKAINAAGYDRRIEELANQAGLTRHTISRWERGPNIPTESTVNAVARVLAAPLEVSPDELAYWLQTGKHAPHRFKFPG